MNTWLSENPAKEARTCIILGSINDDVLAKELRSHPKGVLLVSGNNPTISNPLIHYANPNTDSFEDIIKQIDNFCSLDYNSIPSLKVSTDVQNDNSEFYSNVLSEIKVVFDSFQRARRTRSETGYLKQDNILRNLPFVIRKQFMNELGKAASGQIVCVIGAGPSLDVTLPILQKWDFPKIIIATDSTLEGLLDAGIQPDFVTSIDPEKNYESCCPSQRTSGILIANSITHPSWFQKWDENKISIVSGQVMTDSWLNNNGIKKTEVEAINNAGLTAISLANFMNPEIIILFGMDLSAEVNTHGNRYAEVTKRSHIKVESTYTHKIPGNFTKLVETPFLSDWKDTSDFCKNISPTQTIVNFNDRGAIIEGSTVIHPNKAEELQETFIAFTEEAPPLSLPKSFKESKISQALIKDICILCDKANYFIKNTDPSSPKAFTSLIELLQDNNFSSFFGDFSFTVMPKILQKGSLNEQEITVIIRDLQVFLYILEDALLELIEDEEMIIQFFSDTFYP